jgi:hypothetical protein
LLSDVPAPTLRACPKATVVAEKLHAVAVLGVTHARMKDFFDLWVLLQDTTLDDAELQRAVEATFARRQTAMPSARPIGLSDAFADDATKQLQWRGFLKRNKLEPMDLGEVVRIIRERALQFGFTGASPSRRLFVVRLHRRLPDLPNADDRFRVTRGASLRRRSGGSPVAERWAGAQRSGKSRTKFRLALNSVRSCASHAVRRAGSIRRPMSSTIASSSR